MLGVLRVLGVLGEADRVRPSLQWLGAEGEGDVSAEGAVDFLR